ncbi:type I-F CRISPR-associated protein Csy3 [Seleniivibrio woodruffii]|uniref:CRISPR-associated Csy3 family protein n=1 Tax=Seleniivibrio woodruffii TaxID=1078050 RepID=A0A4R1K836_9BACT|nr:type I-F CRISPR-associated protein Csy3 [Seleniivibrio woodruffii]TCK60434.1 CRISPR-associated Csy3 family protein [Seleniivibrio woodruffii]TVZ36062.1 CRISPR-associated protein, Csy3 family [Seleniivibrio woodruffii]
MALSKNASVLAFERKIDVSDALFYGGKWDDKANYGTWPQIELKQKSVRGTISNRMKAKEDDPAKFNAKIESANLQTVDVAALPSDADTLCVRFSLKVLSGIGTPSACNLAEYQEKLKATVEAYKAEFGFKILADRYAYNIANGRFLWRNRVGAEQVEVVVNRVSAGKTEKSWTFDGFEYPLSDFSKTDKKVSELGDAIADGLAGSSFVIFDVTAFARLGKGQEVFPSQELILDGGSGKGKKSRTLYEVSGAAGLHSQKVGNAIRTIDTWYDDLAEMPIAVEPYGSVTSLGCAYRQPKDKTDFYNLLDNWMLKDKKPSAENQHFVMAIFVRGGVFGEAEKD